MHEITIHFKNGTMRVIAFNILDYQNGKMTIMGEYDKEKRQFDKIEIIELANVQYFYMGYV